MIINFVLHVKFSQKILKKKSRITLKNINHIELNQKLNKFQIINFSYDLIKCKDRLLFLSKTISNNIGSHFQCLLTNILWIIIGVLHFPAIAQIRLITVETYQTTFIK